jgi:hypothetical protein
VAWVGKSAVCVQAETAADLESALAFERQKIREEAAAATQASTSQMASQLRTANERIVEMAATIDGLKEQTPTKGNKPPSSAAESLAGARDRALYAQPMWPFRISTGATNGVLVKHGIHVPSWHVNAPAKLTFKPVSRVPHSFFVYVLVSIYALSIHVGRAS